MEIVQALVGFGADINAKNNQGETGAWEEGTTGPGGGHTLLTLRVWAALMWFVTVNGAKKGAVQLLVKLGADVNAENDDEWTGACGRRRETGCSS